MAPLEEACHSCGQKAPLGRVGQALKQKAEAHFGAGNLTEAVRQLSRALDAGLPEGEGPLAWRKLGVWQDKLAQLPQAAASFGKARELNDADELAHQLWIAALAKMGRMEEAKSFYAARLEKNVEDAVAARQLKVLALSADFLANPKTYAPPAYEPKSWMEKVFLFSPAKAMVLGANLVFSLGLAAITWLRRPPLEGLPASDEIPEIPNIGALLLGDPVPWLLSAALSGLILFFLFFNRR